MDYFPGGENLKPSPKAPNFFFLADVKQVAGPTTTPDQGIHQGAQSLHMSEKGWMVYEYVQNNHPNHPTGYSATLCFLVVESLNSQKKSAMKHHEISGFCGFNASDLSLNIHFVSWKSWRLEMCFYLGALERPLDASKRWRVVKNDSIHEGLQNTNQNVKQ